MKTVIIKYNAGNTQSVIYALERLGVEALITDVEEEIRNADHVIFPGVGEASTAMNYLKERNLDKVIKSLKQPVLGICVGMQLLCAHSEENDVECMGIFDVNIKKFKNVNGHKEKIPQMGWNKIYDLKTGLLKNVKEQEFVYFVHSYYAPVCENTIATTNFIQPFSAALQKDNFYALQFHTEKSSDAGAVILSNFLNISSN